MPSLADQLWAQPQSFPEMPSSVPLPEKVGSYEWAMAQRFNPLVTNQASWEWLQQHWPVSQNVEDRRNDPQEFTPEELATKYKEYYHKATRTAEAPRKQTDWEHGAESVYGVKRVPDFRGFKVQR